MLDDILYIVKAVERRVRDSDTRWILESLAEGRGRDAHLGRSDLIAAILSTQDARPEIGSRVLKFFEGRPYWGVVRGYSNDGLYVRVPFYCCNSPPLPLIALRKLAFPPFLLSF